MTIKPPHGALARIASARAYRKNYSGTGELPDWLTWRMEITEQALAADSAAVDSSLVGARGLAVVPIRLSPEEAQVPYKQAAGSPIICCVPIETPAGQMIELTASWGHDDDHPGVEFCVTWTVEGEGPETELLILFRSTSTREVLGSPHHMGAISKQRWEAKAGELGFDPCAEPWELDVLLLLPPPT